MANPELITAYAISQQQRTLNQIMFQEIEDSPPKQEITYKKPSLNSELTIEEDDKQSPDQKPQEESKTIQQPGFETDSAPRNASISQSQQRLNERRNFFFPDIVSS